MAVSEPKPRPNDTLPLLVGVWYLLRPGYPSSDWVEIYKLDEKYVWARGVYPNIADYKVLRTRFDDNITEFRPGPSLTVLYLLTQEGGILLGEQSQPLIYE